MPTAFRWSAILKLGSGTFTVYWERQSQNRKKSFKAWIKALNSFHFVAACRLAAYDHDQGLKWHVVIDAFDLFVTEIRNCATTVAFSSCRGVQKTFFLLDNNVSSQKKMGHAGIQECRVGSQCSICCEIFQKRQRKTERERDITAACGRIHSHWSTVVILTELNS